MAEGFPGYIPEISLEDDDDDDEKYEKRTSRKPERGAEKAKLKEQKAEEAIEKRDRDDNVPIDKLAEDEKPIIAAELARARVEQSTQELAGAAAESIEQLEATSVVEFNEVLQANLETGQPLDEALNNAEQDVLDLIGTTDSEEATLETVADAELDESDQAQTVATGGTGSPAGPISPADSFGTISFDAQAVSGGQIDSAAAFNTPPSSSNVAPMVVTEQMPVAPYVLAGGLVGYLIGRRRGRIKTEKRLLPIQHKLEKEVAGLEQQIIVREEKIRTLTRQQAKLQPNLRANMAERKQAKGALSSEQAASLSRPATERLGRLVFNNETVKIEQSKTEQTKSVDLMTVPELLVIAEHIKIEQADVKSMHEMHLITDEGLRKIVRAYLRGESYQREVREQLTSPDMKNMEVDPQQQHATSRISSSTSLPATNYTATYQAATPPQQAKTTVPLDTNVSPDEPFPIRSNQAMRRVILVTVVVLVLVIAAWFLVS